MNIRKLFYTDNISRILLFLFFPGMCVITTAACGYTEKNATGNVLLLFLLLILAHRNTLTSITALGNDSNLLIVFYVQIMPDDFVMQLH
ncbi:hypothetical protein OSK18_26245, partial [Escherichia coli]|nr:hypothetical protein [Escherichia coli]